MLETTVPTDKRRYAFWISPEHREALQTLRVRDGVLPSETIRRALDSWFKTKGIGKKARKRAGTRTRS